MRRILTQKQKEEIIINYIRKNPKTTTNEIKKNTKLHIERIFANGMGEAYKKAKVKFPRKFKRMNKEERRKIIIDFIKKNPKAGGHTIIQETKINVANAFKNIEEAYKEARIKYPRKIDRRTKKNKIKEILSVVRENPQITIHELRIKTNTKPYNFFKDIEEIYSKAGVKSIPGNEKWKIKKRKEIIKFIKQNSLATQREINNNCKTHVQDLFSKGIFEAYEKASMPFPFERLKLYGVGIKEIRDRAKNFEEEIAINLSGYGSVNRLVKTKRGFADIIFERKGKKAVIEIKDYKNKDISISQIKQLNKYLEDCNCNLGFLICHKKPRKDKFLIGKNKIFVLIKEELKQIPKLMRIRS